MALLIQHCGENIISKNGQKRQLYDVLKFDLMNIFLDKGSSTFVFFKCKLTDSY